MLHGTLYVTERYQPYWKNVFGNMCLENVILEMLIFYIVDLLLDTCVWKMLIFTKSILLKSGSQNCFLY